MAPKRSLTVAISGDPRDFQRSLSIAGKDAERFEKKLTGIGSKVGKAFAGLGAAAGGAAVVGLKKSVDAAVEADKAQARLNAQLETIGKNTPAIRKNIDDVVAAQSRMSGRAGARLSAGERMARLSPSAEGGYAPAGSARADRAASVRQWSDPPWSSHALMESTHLKGWCAVCGIARSASA